MASKIRGRGFFFVRTYAAASCRVLLGHHAVGGDPGGGGGVEAVFVNNLCRYAYIFFCFFFFRWSRGAG